MSPITTGSALRLSRRIFLLFALLAALFVPGMALASGAEAKVALVFNPQDQIYLYVSLGLGVLAIVAGIWLKSTVLANSPGNEKMQEVGNAIHQGALAYLRQQISTMVWFVLGIAIVLVLIYSKTYDSWMLGGLTALSFVLGVAASYMAGYWGMDMAVRGNMRTAHAALTSYGKSLEIAFKSGAVAGLLTVGLGLVGATAIIIIFPQDAMKLLIGFGFGGSLAALFMRVGGGIFTKAADVGADLVGKVEAGIPEDDPRNPATIADNVGDNVGDCAGMAADIFESYEVTLVAAIVLGAATSMIFDSATVMKLILFALMARGIGIVASILGIISVKGSDDLNADPLKPISKGFLTSAAIALIGTAGLAFLLMNGVKTSRAVSLMTVAGDKLKAIRSIRDTVASETQKQPEDIQPADLKKDGKFRPEILALNLPEEALEQIVQQAMTMGDEDLARFDVSTEGFKEVALDSPELAKFTAVKQDFTTSKTEYKTMKEAWGNARIWPLKGKAENGKERPMYMFAVDKKDIEQTATQNNMTWEEPKDGLPVRYYLGPKNKLMIGAAIPADVALQGFSMQTGMWQIYSASKEEVQSTNEERTKKSEAYSKLLADAQKLKGDAQAAKQQEANKLQLEMAKIKTIPTVAPMQGVVDEKPVEWWRFFLCILVGVVMAWVMERLTDYYVSTHKKPVLEVAGVSSAGPAPMIIQGFAYAAESSVFSVFAIVLALIMPLLIFPAAVYGGYILSFYGIALVGLGLLTTTGYILAMDTFGPISDNAQGVFEMSGAGHDSPTGSKAVQRLDAAGNTTKALTKGFAIATAVVAAVALFHSYVEDAHLSAVGMRLEVPEIFLGLLIGAAAPYLFSAFSINAVGRAAFQLINEVRSQFRNDPGIMAGTSKPNYASCVAIVTAAAQKELLGPGILAIALPVAVGFGFGIGKDPVGGYNLVGAQALGGFLTGAILSGQLLAVLLANSGGMWDNAKKLIEDGMHGGKGTDAHKAGVVCDTVGDPFKDTAGPALNPLIKVMNLVALLLAPVVITNWPTPVRLGVTLFCVAALAFSIYWSKRGSFSQDLQSTGALEEGDQKSLKH